jgi:hypothetical protein
MDSGDHAFALLLFNCRDIVQQFNVAIGSKAVQGKE